MATNSSSTKDVDCSSSESDKSDKKNPHKQDTINTFFKIIPRRGSEGGPKALRSRSLPKRQSTRFGASYKNIQQRENLDCSTAMNWTFAKEDLKICRYNRNGTDIEGGMMSAEAECIPISTIYSKENRVGDCTFTKHNYFKDRDRCSLMLGINNCFKI